MPDPVALGLQGTAMRRHLLVFPSVPNPISSGLLDYTPAGHHSQHRFVTVQGGWTKREKWFMIFLDASKEHRSQGSRGTTVGKPGPMLPGEPESEKAAGASRATAARE